MLDFSETFSKNANLELFLRQIEKKLFVMPKTRLGYSSFTNKESDLVCSLPDAWSIVIKNKRV